MKRVIWVTVLSLVGASLVWFISNAARVGDIFWLGVFTLGGLWNSVGGWLGLILWTILAAIIAIMLWAICSNWRQGDKQPEEPITQPLQAVKVPVVTYDPVREAGGWHEWEVLSDRAAHDLSGKIRFPYDYDAAEEFDMIVEQHLKHIGWVLQEQEERGEQA